jgi:hypothetical protein
MNDFFIPAVIFTGIYYILKNFTDFLLKRKIIKAGHFDKAGILEQQVSSETGEAREVNKYPSLKWGLVAFFAGIGFIIINQMSPSVNNEVNFDLFMQRSVLPFGIELVSISLGFIVYFLIVNFSKRK